jgi:ATP-binding cassette subfamily F protein uup
MARRGARGREREQHKLDRKIVAEEHWMRYGVTARASATCAGREAERLREKRRTMGHGWQRHHHAGSRAPSGALVIEAKNLGKSLRRSPIVATFSTRIQRGDRIGIVGPNGSGKTTLVNLLTRRAAPIPAACGSARTLAMATLNQQRDSLDPSVTVADALTGGDGDNVLVNGQRKHVVSYMKDFLFTAEQARTPLGKLSGGERGRLMLAQTLAKSSNLLVLDEPTNDLDMETLDVLEDMLATIRARCCSSATIAISSIACQRCDRAGRQRPLARLCRRLQRHAGAARQRSHARAAQRAAKANKTVNEPAPPVRATVNKTADDVQGQARA